MAEPLTPELSLEARYAVQLEKAMAGLGTAMAQLCPDIELQPELYTTNPMPLISDLAKTRIAWMRETEAKATIEAADKAEADAAADAAASKTSALQGVVCWLDAHLEGGDGDVSKALEATLVRLGAKTLTLGKGKPTHLVFKNSASREWFNKAEAKGLLIVGTAWVDACEQEGRLVAEAGYPAEPLVSSPGPKKGGISLARKRKTPSMVPGAHSGVDPDASRFNSSQAYPETSRAPLAVRNTSAERPSAPAAKKQAGAARQTRPGSGADASFKRMEASPSSPGSAAEPASPTPRPKSGRKGAKPDAQPKASKPTKRAAAKGSPEPALPAAAAGKKRPATSDGPQPKGGKAKAKADAKPLKTDAAAGGLLEGTELRLATSGMEDESDTRGTVAAVLAGLGHKAGFKGFKVVSEPKSSPTHIITNHKHRTFRVALGLLRGTPVVSPEWLFASVEREGWLPHEPYVLLELRKGSAPLKGEKVCVKGPFDPSVDAKAVERIVKEAGGKLSSAHEANVLLSQHGGYDTEPLKWLFDRVFEAAAPSGRRAPPKAVASAGKAPARGARLSVSSPAPKPSTPVAVAAAKSAAKTAKKAVEAEVVPAKPAGTPPGTEEMPNSPAPDPEEVDAADRRGAHRDEDDDDDDEDVEDSEEF